MKKKVTIKDIAEYVGVSPMTVSFVLNKNPKQKISAETTQRVLDAVEKLHYIPNNAAKALRSSKTFCIGVVLEKSIVVQRYAEVLEGIRVSLAKADYSMLLCNGQGEAVHEEYIRYFQENKVDGIIYVGRDGSTIPDEVIEKIHKYKIPFVTLDCENMKGKVSSVDFDYYYGAYEHTRFLIAQGARGFLYLRPKMDIRQERDREQGVLQAAKEAGNIPVYCHYLSYEEQNQEGMAYSTAKYYDLLQEEIRTILLVEEELLSRYATIICSWGSWVEPVLARCMQMEKKITLAGFAEGNLYSSLWENISCSRLPNYEGGRLCVELLLKQLQEEAEIQNEVLRPQIPGGI